MSSVDTHHLLHTLWTKAVGTDGYVKAEWRQLEAVLNDYAQLVNGLARGERRVGERRRIIVRHFRIDTGKRRLERRSA